MARVSAFHFLLTLLAVGLAAFKPAQADEPRPKAILRGHEYHVRAVAFAPDGKTLASVATDADVVVWGADAHRRVTTLTIPDNWGTCVAFSPDGRALAAGGREFDNPSKLRVWDPATRKELYTLAFGTEALAFSPDSKLLAAGGYADEGAGVVRLWDAATGKEKGVLKCERGVRALAFSPDGKTLASAGWDKAVTLWDVPTGARRVNLTGHADGVQSVAFSPDGTILAAGDDFGAIRLWDPATGKLRSTIRGQVRGVNSVAFSPDGKLIAAAGYDGTIGLWDAATGAVRGLADAHTPIVSSLAFSPDGKTMAASSDRAIRLWDVGALVGWVLPDDARVNMRFRSENYRLTWQKPDVFPHSADLEVGLGGGHEGTLRWFRLRPVKDGVEVLDVSFDEGWHPYKSKWPPDLAPVTVRRASMRAGDYERLLKDLALVDSARLRRPRTARFGGSFSDFWVQTRLSAGDKSHMNLDWAGYEGSADELQYAKSRAACDLTEAAVHWLDFQVRELTADERAWASGKFVRDWARFKDKSMYWWVAERYIQTIGVVGDKSVLPALRDILSSERPKDELSSGTHDGWVYAAINAITRLTKVDVREQPVEEMDLEKTRRKILELLRDRK